MPHTKKDGGFGLINIRERVESQRGNFKIDSALNQGTLLVVDLPLELEAT